MYPVTPTMNEIESISIDAFLDQHRVLKDPSYRQLIRDRVVALKPNPAIELNALREYWENERRTWRKMDDDSMARRRDAEAWLEAIGYVVAHPETGTQSSATLDSTELTLHSEPVPRAEFVSSPVIPVAAIGTVHTQSLSIPVSTVKSFVKDYLAYVQTNFAKKTLRNAERVMRKFEEMFGDRPLASLTFGDLEKYKSARQAEGVSTATINIDTKTIKAAFAVAVDLAALASNPFVKVKPIKANQRKPAHLTEDDFVKLIQSIDKPWLLDIVRIGVLTGMRLGEIMNLRWSDYDAANKEINIVSSDLYRVKGGKMRTIPLVGDASSILDGKKQRSEWIFVNEKGKKCTNDYVSKLLKVYVRKVGLSEEIHFHSLRHTYCTWAAEAHMSTHVLMALAGHSSLRVTEQYIGQDKEYQRAEGAKVKLPVTPKPEPADPSQDKP